MKKQAEPVFQMGDVVRVIMPTMAVNLKEPEEGEKKLQIDEVLLVGDEGMVVVNVEYVKRSNEYLYQVLTENSLDSKMFSIPEDQLTLFQETTMKQYIVNVIEQKITPFVVEADDEWAAMEKAKEGDGYIHETGSFSLPLEPTSWEVYEPIRVWEEWI